MQLALRSGHAQTVAEMLSCDDTLAHIPVKTATGCEPPLIAAIEMGCSAAVVAALLSHGVPMARSRCGAPALHTLILSLEKEKALSMFPPWPDAYHEDSPEFGDCLFQKPGHAAEKRTRDLARCLLRYGADAEERWQGLLPAEMAARSGKQLLAAEIEQFVWRRVRPLLAKHRLAARAAKRDTPQLLACREDVYELVCKFLAPT